MKMKLILNTIMDSDHVVALIEQAISEGLDRRETIRAIVDIIDDVIDWERILPNPTGAVVEILDGPVVSLCVAIVWRRIERASRKENGRTRRMLAKKEAEAHKAIARRERTNQAG